MSEQETAIAVVETVQGEEKDRGLELLQKLGREAEAQTAMAKKQLNLARLSAAFLGVMAAAVVLFVGVALPRVNATLANADSTLQGLEAVTKQLEEADLAAILGNLDQTLTDGRESLADASEAMQRVSSIDFESLNKAITDLQRVLDNPLGSLFGRR